MSKFVVGDQNVIFQTMNYLFLNKNFALKRNVYSTSERITIKRLTRYKQKVVLAAMLEGKSMPFNMAANTNQINQIKSNQSKCHKISFLNAFPLKFRV